jgi:hypothetical protein
MARSCRFSTDDMNLSQHGTTVGAAGALRPILRQIDSGDQRLVSVCAWCLPGERLFEQFPWLRGNVEISHGVCPEHKAEFMRSLRQPKEVAA